MSIHMKGIERAFNKSQAERDVILTSESPLVS